MFVATIEDWVAPRPNWVLTLHEVVIRGRNAWVTANKNLPMNLSRYGGAYNGALIDSAVQEYDLRTGRLVRTWDALHHIPLSDSRASLPSRSTFLSLPLASTTQRPTARRRHLPRILSRW